MDESKGVNGQRRRDVEQLSYSLSFFCLLNQSYCSNYSAALAELSTSLYSFPERKKIKPFRSTFYGIHHGKPFTSTRVSARGKVSWPVLSLTSDWFVPVSFASSNRKYNNAWLIFNLGFSWKETSRNTSVIITKCSFIIVYFSLF